MTNRTERTAAADRRTTPSSREAARRQGDVRSFFRHAAELGFDRDDEAVQREAAELLAGRIGLMSAIDRLSAR